MCLNIKEADQREIAQEDITVYKIYNKTKTDTLRSFFQNTKTQRGEQPKVKIKKAMWFQMLNIEEGYHSFKYIQDAEELGEYELRTNITDIALVECIIPKGAEYYLGTFNTHRGPVPSYASDQLIVGEELKTYYSGKIWGGITVN